MTGQLLAFAEPHRRGLGDAGRLPDRNQQLVEVDRFGQIIDRPVAHGADRLANVGIRRHEQDRQHRVLQARAAKGFQTRNARHAHIGDHHVEIPTAENLQRAFAGSDGDGVEALAFEKRIEQAALSRVVIDDQDARRFRCAVASIRWHRRSS